MRTQEGMGKALRASQNPEALSEDHVAKTALDRSNFTYGFELFELFIFVF